MRFFADQCVPFEIVRVLREHGHEALPLRDHLPIRSPDPVVIAKAQQLDCLLVSLNGDFGDIITYPPERFGGIVALQLHNHPEIVPQLMATLVAFLDRHRNRDFYRGKLFVVEVHRIRVRT